MTLSADTTMLTHSLAWALLYSLWQGLLVYGLLYVLLKALPELSARVKYYLAIGSFGALFAWFAATWAAQYDKLKGTVTYVAAAATGPDATTLTHTATPLAAAHQPAAGWQWAMPSVEPYLPAIMVLYTLGLMFMTGRIALNVVQLRSLRRNGITMPAKKWMAFVDEWKKAFRISRPVALLLSTGVDVPAMLGTLKPVILLPVAMVSQLSTAQVEAILLHELAHIKRHDYLVNILQAIGETVLFFNPWVWLISGIVRRERELCCDDIVVASTASPLCYAEALAMMAGARGQSSMALAATGSKNQLFHRIKRIMEMKKNNLNHSQLTIAIVAILGITIAVAMLTFSPSYAQKVKKIIMKDTVRKSVYKKVTIDKNGRKVVEESTGDNDEHNAAGPGNIIEEIEIAKGPSSDNMPKDGSVLKFTTADGTKVMAWIYNDAKDRTEVIRKIVFDKREGKINWDNVRAELMTKVTDACKRLTYPPKQNELTAEVDKLISKQKEQAWETEPSVAKEYRPDYSEDTAIVRFMTKDGTNVWARLSDEPKGKKRMIEEINFEKKSDEKTDWDEVKTSLNTMIANAYRGHKDAPSSSEISKEVNELIDRQKQFAHNIPPAGSARQKVMKNIRIENKDTQRNEAREEKMKAAEEMGKEGLLDPMEYSIAMTNGDLYIDGKKQPKSVTDKYGKYFEENSQIEVTHKNPYQH